MDQTVQALDLSFLDVSMIDVSPPASPILPITSEDATSSISLNPPDVTLLTSNIAQSPDPMPDIGEFSNVSEATTSSIILNPPDIALLNSNVSQSSAMSENSSEVATTTTVCSSDIASANQCDICNKFFSSKSTLNRHLKKHDPGWKYNCKTCNKFYKTQAALDMHKSVNHPGNHLCVTCGRTFSRKNGLTDHSLRHKDATTYRSPSKRLLLCPFENCGKKFLRKTLYQDHLNVHSNLKPYSCDVCQKQFSSRYRLNFHKRVCSGALKFICDVCNINLTDPDALKRHKEGKHGLKTHACLCGKHYKYYSSLYKHKKEKNH